jgi:hypothetical protein
LSNLCFTRVHAVRGCLRRQRARSRRRLGSGTGHADARGHRQRQGIGAADQRARAGRWEATAPGYDEVYILDVESGPDNVHGVRVDGPDIHVFTAPTAGASVNSTLVVPIAWDRQDSAQSASIDTDNVDHLSISDTGTFSLPAGSLKAEKDTVHSNTIKIERTNRVTPAGAQGGSELTVSVENEIDVIVQPNPAL